MTFLQAFCSRLRLYTGVTMVISGWLIINGLLGFIALFWLSSQPFREEIVVDAVALSIAVNDIVFDQRFQRRLH